MQGIKFIKKLVKCPTDVTGRHEHFQVLRLCTIIYIKAFLDTYAGEISVPMLIISALSIPFLNITCNCLLVMAVYNSINHDGQCRIKVFAN